MNQTPAGSGTIFADGYFAGRMGDSRVTNPQKKDSVAASVWFAGWDEGNAITSRKKAEPKPLEPTSR